MGVLYDLQNNNVFSLRLKVWRTLSDRVFQFFGGCTAEGSLAELDRSKNRSMFDAHLTTGSSRQCVAECSGSSSSSKAAAVVM